MHDTAPLSDEQVHAHLPWVEALILHALPADPPRRKPGKRGRPQQVCWSHLWFQWVLGVLLHWQSYQDLRRALADHPLGPFPKVAVTDDAIIKRLRQAGLAPLQELLARLSAHLTPLLSSRCPCTLAPFAREILALDETSWDAVQRHLPSVRGLPNGDVGLRPGKLAARFNLRTQLWDWVQFRDNALGNCKLDVCSLLDGVLPGSLLLFDLGYFSFAFLDYLSELHFWFISRIRQDVHYQIAHTFYRHEGTLDALVWLGGTGRNSSRSGQLVRLIRFWDGTDLRMYLTNQTDPCLLPLPDIARLYARRWDIELAFLTLKKHLGLHHWWSAVPVLRQQQALVVLIASQVLHACRLLIAAEQGCDPFEVSLPLLTDWFPQLLVQRQHPVAWAMTHGPSNDLFRPSTRLQVQVPSPPLQDYLFPPADLLTHRLASYREYAPRPHRNSFHRSSSSRPPCTSPPFKQLSLFSPTILRHLKAVHI